MSRLSILLCTSPSSSSLINPLLAAATPLGYRLIKKYSKRQGEDGKEENVLDKERAPSTEEIMDELTQSSREKEDIERRLDEKSQQGFVSHTSDKVLDAAKDAITADADPQAVKETYKEGSPAQTYHKPRDDGGVGHTSV